MDSLLSRYHELATHVTKTLEQTRADLLKQLQEVEARLNKQLTQLRADLLLHAVDDTTVSESEPTPLNSSSSVVLSASELIQKKSDSESAQKSNTDNSQDESTDETELFDLLASLHKTANPKTPSGLAASDTRLTSWTSHASTRQSDHSRSNTVKMGKKRDSLPKEPQDSQEEQSTSNPEPKGNEIADAKRVICAVIYRGITEIEGRQKKTTPKKYKGAFEGNPSISSFLCKLGQAF
jgi:hypothetical protein